jgi:hypothetical protein
MRLAVGPQNRAWHNMLIRRSAQRRGSRASSSMIRGHVLRRSPIGGNSKPEPARRKNSAWSKGLRLIATIDPVGENHDPSRCSELPQGDWSAGILTRPRSALRRVSLCAREAFFQSLRLTERRKNARLGSHDTGDRHTQCKRRPHRLGMPTPAGRPRTEAATLRGGDTQKAPRDCRGA